MVSRSRTRNTTSPRPSSIFIPSSGVMAKRRGRCPLHRLPWRRRHAEPRRREHWMRRELSPPFVLANVTEREPKAVPLEAHYDQAEAGPGVELVVQEPLLGRARGSWRPLRPAAIRSVDIRSLDI